MSLAISETVEDLVQANPNTASPDGVYPAVGFRTSELTVRKLELKHFKPKSASACRKNFIVVDIFCRIEFPMPKTTMKPQNSSE